jgi:excisionase family DNA binding protein
MRRHDTTSGQEAPRGMTPREVAVLLRVSGDKIRALIRRGELQAVDMGERPGRARLIVLPEHLAAFVRRRAAATALPAPPRRRRREPGFVDYMGD